MDSGNFLSLILPVSGFHPAEFSIGNAFLSRELWGVYKGIGEAVSSAHGRECLAASCGTSQRPLILRAPCSRTTCVVMRELGAVGYAHRSKAFSGQQPLDPIPAWYAMRETMRDVFPNIPN